MSQMDKIRLETDAGEFIVAGKIITFGCEFPEVVQWGGRVFQFEKQQTHEQFTTYREILCQVVTQNSTRDDRPSTARL